MYCTRDMYITTIMLNFGCVVNFLLEPLPQNTLNLLDKTRYGLTEQEVQAMFAAQKGVCASCGNPETAIVKRTGKPKMLHIDHDHETGTVRALLCQDCNIALGHLRHNSKRIQALFYYAVGYGL